MSTHDRSRDFVVDPTREEGGYQTLAAAIEAAKDDGASPDTPRYVFARAGVYAEDVEVPPGVYVVGEGTIPP